MQSADGSNDRAGPTMFGSCQRTAPLYTAYTAGVPTARRPESHLKLARFRGVPLCKPITPFDVHLDDDITNIRRVGICRHETAALLFGNRLFTFTQQTLNTPELEFRRSLGEDASQVRTGAAPQVMAALRTLQGTPARSAVATRWETTPQKHRRQQCFRPHQTYSCFRPPRHRRGKRVPHLAAAHPAAAVCRLAGHQPAGDV